MEDIAIDVAKNEVQSLVNLVKNEAQYLCCFSSYAGTFEQKKKELEAKLQDMNIEIEKASGVSRVTNEAHQWVGEAGKLIEVDTRKEKCFKDLCLNCWRQYRKGKDLAEKTQQIGRLLERRNNFDIVAGPADIPSIKYRSLPNFMHFKSRMSKFQELKEALQDENCNMIGLQGLGGTGKTSMATEVGAELEGPNFGKVIFLVVSKPPDFKKLQGEIARRLDLKLEGANEDEHREKILSKITNMKEKLLIILDDVWAEFDLTKELGIPPRQQHKGCSSLITTRNSDVCTKMECQRTIHLEILTHEEALTLFREVSSTNNSSGLKGVTKNIVKYCYGVPVVIVAVARTLKGKPPEDWKEALNTLQKDKFVLNINEDLKKVYGGLKLSYDQLKNEKAQKLLVISSLFPEDFEIPMELMTKIGVGMGPFGGFDDYNERRKKVLDARAELLNSSLLLYGERRCVKIHDLVREVALLIGGKDIQSIMDSKQHIKENLQYLCWKNDDFLSEFDGKKLEILLIFIDGSNALEVRDTFFAKMKGLKVLLLENTIWFRRTLAPSLIYSLQSLEDIRTLILNSLELYDISILGNLPSLETLELFDCSITELPRLKMLKMLAVEQCEIEMNNPFKAIEGYSQLEELTFVHNTLGVEEYADFQNVSLRSLHRYQISSGSLSELLISYGSLSRCFQPKDLGHLVSEATFKQLVRTTELLVLEGCEETRWKNLIPDIVPAANDGGMNDLNILVLDSCPNIRCLIDTENHYSNMIAFSSLVELHLLEMDVEYLYRGPMPSGFLEQLEIVKLDKCRKLKSILFNGSLSLFRLKFMELEDCPLLTSIFQPLTAQSLVQLEEIVIKNCSALECIIEIVKSSGGEKVDDDGDNKQKNFESLFPKLRTLQIVGCDKLKYIFDKSFVLPSSLKEMELSGVPSLIGIFGEYQEPMASPMQNPSRDNSWAQVCCFPNKSKERLLRHRTSQGLLASKKWIDTSNILWRQLLNFHHIKKMTFAHLPLNLVSLFTLSMASMILWEELTITKFDGLKRLITREVDDYQNEQINCISIFPKLEKLEIRECKDLKFLFPSTTKSVEIKRLQSLTIKDTPKLKYVVGKYHHDEDRLSNKKQNDKLHIDLPALEVLCFEGVPNIINICVTNYYLACPSMQEVVLENCNIKSFTDQLVACSNEEHLNWKTKKEIKASTDGSDPSFQRAKSLIIQSFNNVKHMELVDCSNLTSLSSLASASTMLLLQTLTIKRCHQLKCIVVADEGDNSQDPLNYFSIFPKLEKLEIQACKELEFLFSSMLSVQLNTLKSLIILDNLKLKYLIGKYQRENHLSNLNQNDELHISLPTLEVLSLQYVPNIKPFLDSMICPNEEHQNWKPTMELDKSINVNPHSQAAQSLMRLSLSNIQEMKLVNFSNIISLLTLSTASKMILLKELTIEECQQLKCIVADEGDDGAQSNNNSVFPRLKDLRVFNCDAMEYLFPAFAFRSPLQLEYLWISDAPKLRYVFGRSHHEDKLSDENQDIKTCIDFPALYNLHIMNAPNLIDIYPKNYCLRGLSLSYITLKKSPEFVVRSFTDFMLCDHTRQQDSTTAKEIEIRMQTLENLEVYDFKIQEIFSLTHLQVEKNCQGLEPLTSSLRLLKLQNLTELRNICVGPKCILSLNNLWWLDITACKRLKVIFSASTLRRLPKLEILRISKCKELVQIIEEDNEESIGDHLSHGPCLPKLSELIVKGCDKLKYLFSVTTSGILPNLQVLKIKKAISLEHVLIRPDGQKGMAMEDLLPKLSDINLNKLLSLISLCHGIDFRKLEKTSKVVDCPKFSFYENTSTQCSYGFKTQDSGVSVETEKELSSHGIEEATDEIVEEDAISSKMPKTISDSKVIQQSIVEVRAEGVSSNTLPPSSLTFGKTSEEAGHTAVLEGSNSEKLEARNQIKDPELRKAMPTTPIVTISQDKASKIVEAIDEGEVSLESLRPSSLTSKKDGLVGGKEAIIIDPQSFKETRPDIHSNDSKNIVEVSDKDESSETSYPSSLTSKKKGPIPMSHNPTVLLIGDNTPTTAKIFEEEEEVGSITTRHNRKGLKDLISLPQEKPKPSVHGDPTLLKASTSLKQNPSPTPSKPTYGINIQNDVEPTDQQTHEADKATIGHVSLVDLIPSFDPHQIVKHYDGTKSNVVENAQSSLSPSFAETNQQALIGPDVQGIVDMMKLDGLESSLLARAIETHPQLLLSTNDRSKWMLCNSYRVLLNILNVLTTRTPFTITEADKRLLEENLKDADFLGFDKAWLESIRTKVFYCEISEVDRIQEVVKGLDNDLKTNEAMLAAICDEEVEAGQEVQVAHKGLDEAQHKHANVIARHTYLLKARQDILARWHQCWEKIATMNRHFEF